MVAISSIAFAVRTASTFSSCPIKLSHAQQLVAAAFGYRSLASFQGSKEETPDLSEARHFILNQTLLQLRATELGLSHTLDELNFLLQVAFEDRLPLAKLYVSDRDFDDYVRAKMSDKVINDSDACSAMAMTNSDGIQEIYLPFDDVLLSELPLDGQEWEQEFAGQVNMKPDIERPYVGQRIDIEACLTIRRLGRAYTAEPECEVISARLNFSWGEDEGEGRDRVEQENDGRDMTLVQIFAAEFGLELSEAAELVDVEPQEDASDDGLVYGYIFNFEGVASPAVAAKLIARYKTLNPIYVGPMFYDQLSPFERL